MKWKCLSGAALAAVAMLCACSPVTPQSPSSALLDPNGSFVLYVSNQSFAITPIDIQVQIDGEVVIRQEFEVGTQHNWQVFKLELPHGKHTLSVSSSKGGATLVQDFEVKGKHWAVITYWYYPDSHATSSQKHFRFEILDEQPYFL